MSNPFTPPRFAPMSSSTPFTTVTATLPHASVTLPVGAGDSLSPAARRAAVAGVIAAHLVGAGALLQVEAVRRAVAEAAPVMVDLIAPPARPIPTPPLPPPAVPVQPQPRTPPLPAPLVTAAPSPVPAVFEAPPPPVEPPTPAVVHDAPPAPAPAPPAPVAVAPPPTLAITAVAYLTPPVLTYPATARRFNESGEVRVRVLVDAAGRPTQTVVAKSSGFARLDEAALATVRATRFKPYTEDGVPQPFWVVMPLIFELQR